MCIIQGCTGKPVSKGLCDKHRKRLDKHGSVEAGRPLKWGEKEKHPLYNRWYSLKRNNRLSEEWKDFWSFVRDIKEVPEKHILSRKDYLPYGPNNFYFKEIKLSPKNYEKSSEYQREYRKQNPLVFKQIELKKKFGITLDQYNKLLEDQKGVCAVCGKEETAFDKRQDKLRSLSVDHCHKTGRIRGLLCSHCNHAIGKFNDDVNLLQAAINYLTKE